MDITIIPHAKFRMRGRVYCEDIHQRATLAWRNGLRVDEATGPLKDYLATKQVQGRILAVYHSSAYVFESMDADKLFLVTVLSLPKDYWSMAKKQFTRKMIKCNGQTDV